MKIIAYKGRGRQPWRWRLVARNGKIVADSAEGYSTKSHLIRAVSTLRQAWMLMPPPVFWR